MVDMKMIKRLIGLCLIVSAVPGADADPPLTSQPAVAAFIDQMTQKHGFDKAGLTHLLDEAQIQQSIIDAISKPAENKPWFEYRPIFITESRIQHGVRFLDDYRAILQRAAAQYGVPAEVITAILGVETFYGERVGRHRIIDSLVTLAFDYPARSDFFRSELEAYLLLTREEHLDPLEMKGSYAGAMGLPQFISSSYRTFAVDFDGDGKRDLWTDPADAIGSVANYLKVHGWRPNQEIAVHAHVTGEGYRDALDMGIKPSIDVARLGHFGISPDKHLPREMKAALIQLEDPQGYDYWVGMENFYVITRYNHSPLYAMAVYQLSQAIKSGSEHGVAVIN
jgi:membrane-bound lytic murein transglycosylase B